MFFVWANLFLVLTQKFICVTQSQFIYAEMTYCLDHLLLFVSSNGTLICFTYIEFIYREVWPENDIFGAISMQPDEEFTVMRTIFMADIGAESLGEFSH